MEAIFSRLRDKCLKYGRVRETEKTVNDLNKKPLRRERSMEPHKCDLHSGRDVLYPAAHRIDIIISLRIGFDLVFPDRVRRTDESIRKAKKVP